MSESLSAPALTQTIARLRQLTQFDLQQGWRICEADLPIATALDPQNWQTWTISPLNDRQHIAWEKGQRVLWLSHRLIAPSELKGYPLAGMTLRLSLIWWAEAAQVYVNGNLVQEGDLFDCQTRICLSEAVQPGEVIDLAIRLVSPGHDNGALVRSLLLYERQNRSLQPCPEPGFVADELEVIQTFLTAFAPEELPEVTAAVDSLPWNQVNDVAEFDRALTALRQKLLPWSNLIKQRSLSLLGHAHLDLAWLWEIDDTWKAAERTFRSALDLQQDYPELIFGHSTPALYHWIETNRPELFAEIRSQIKSGQWEVIAGLWLEPELNLISGESIARHILYGQHYAEEKFGQISRVAWLPDTFGFCWQLPQLLRQGGVEYFVTQKLRWNDTTQFPYEAFWWQSPDGSRIFSHHSAPIGEGIDPAKMAKYACQWEQNSGQQMALWLPGVGDHGGGPTRDMLELVRRWQQSPFFPNLEFSTAESFLDRLHSLPSDSLPSDSLPVWQTDLYLEFHRGCYTSHARQKRFNRLSERLLYEAELFSAIATLLLNAEYPQQQIESAWKQVLFNQFHDILPGSAIPEVYEDANQLWQSAIGTANSLKQQALQTIAAHLMLPDPPHPQAQPIVLFNSLTWERSPLIRLTLPAGNWKVWDLEGQPLESAIEPTQSSSPSGSNDSETVCLTFQPSTIPALGYCCYWVRAIEQGEFGAVDSEPVRLPSLPSILSAPEERVGGTEPTQEILLSPKSFTVQSPPNLGDLGGVQDLAGNTESSTSAEKFILENPFRQVTIDSQTGDIARLYDKIQQREVLKGAGNQLQAYRDQGQYWDAWNIDPDYASHPLPPAELLEIRLISNTPLETRIQVIRRLGQSTFYQTYGLTHHSPILTIDTQVDWQERNTIVKAAFPLNLDAAQATYEIPFGAIDRPTRPQTEAEKAQWEVPALTWADLSDETYGVSILSDCKHGYDHQPDQFRLTLLRAPMWPHPDADRGWHEFTYAIYPHSGNWQTAQTVRRGYELTHPVQVILPQQNSVTQPTLQPSLPPQSEFLKISANSPLAAFKRSERNPHQWILRCYEAQGYSEAIDWRSVSGLLTQKLNLQQVCESDLLENSSGAIEPVTQFSPWQIKTLLLQQTR
ncbi:alpha-mannosidase [Leptolyngbya ohadii]|uniref:alpha-mannosidase n=1 Tax=Leptolyngbya ohadii TaxID=1962290 RepID=UPI000B59D5D1|nr:alpha-mannosidase [Leptolyngbya ohadii]